MKKSMMMIVVVIVMTGLTSASGRSVPAIQVKTRHWTSNNPWVDHPPPMMRIQQLDYYQLKVVCSGAVVLTGVNSGAG